MSQTVDLENSSSELLECSLYAEFDVAVPEAEWCPLADTEPPVYVQNQQFHGDTCVVDARIQNPDEEFRVVRMKQECDRRCPSEVLTTNGYMPKIKEMHPDRLVIGVYLDDHQDVRDVVEHLRSVVSWVNLRQLSQIGDDEPVETSILDLTQLTDKQRETVTVAISMGYYQQPRGASITDIAAELDITPSAVSKRLAGVESKVMREVFAEIESVSEANLR